MTPAIILTFYIQLAIKFHGFFPYNTSHVSPSYYTHIGLYPVILSSYVLDFAQVGHRSEISKVNFVQIIFHILINM